MIARQSRGLVCVTAARNRTYPIFSAWAFVGSVDSYRVGTVKLVGVQ